MILAESSSTIRDGTRFDFDDVASQPATVTNPNRRSISLLSNNFASRVRNRWTEEESESSHRVLYHLEDMERPQQT